MAEVASVGAPAYKAGTRTALALVTLSGGANDTINNAKLLAMCPTSGPLFDFLSASYLNDAVAEAAWAAICGEINMRGVTNGVTTLLSSFAWKATGSAPSAALVNAAVAGTFTLLLRANHTITQ